MVGFALQWERQEHGVLWISGDTVPDGGMREVGSRLQAGTAVMHLGGVRFPATAPLRYTMTARDAVELCGLLHPHAVIPAHYQGWSHFQQPKAEIQREFSGASEAIRACVCWLPIGKAVEVTV